MLGRQLDARRPLQLAILDQVGNSTAQRPRVLLAGHRGNELQLVRVFRQVLTPGQPLDQCLVRQLPGFAHAVHQNDPLVPLPHLEVLQDRQERGNPRARGQQPQITPVDKSIQGQVAKGLTIDHQRIACLQETELAGEFAPGYDNGKEFEKLVMGRRHHGIRAPHGTAIGLGDAQAGKLPGPKAKAWIPGGAQGEQTRSQRLDIKQGLTGELLFAGGHGGLRRSDEPSVPQSQAQEHRRIVVVLLLRQRQINQTDKQSTRITLTNA
ncbi:hypothetical protein D3C80_1084390 [compost metagenome]